MCLPPSCSTYSTSTITHLDNYIPQLGRSNAKQAMQRRINPPFQPLRCPSHGTPSPSIRPLLKPKRILRRCPHISQHPRPQNTEINSLALAKLALPVGWGVNFFAAGCTPNLTGGAGPVFCATRGAGIWSGMRGMGSGWKVAKPFC